MVLKPKPLCTRCGFVHPRCVAHLTSDANKACNKWPLTGMNVCANHGGRTRRAKAGAAKNIADAKALKSLKAVGRPRNLGRPVPVDPTTALLDLISWKHAEVLALRERVDRIEAEELVWGQTREQEVGASQYPGLNTVHESAQNMWWRLLRTAEDQLASYASAAHRAGIAEREVKLAEKQGEMVAAVIRRILSALDLTREQQLLVGQVVPRELRGLSASVNST